MTDMTNSRPLFLVVITILLVLVALMVFWLAAMPQQLLGTLKHGMMDQGGFKLEASAPEISFNDGIALKLNAVSLSNDSETSLSAESMTVKMRFSSLFGGGFSAEDIVLNKAVVTLNVSPDAKLPVLLRGRIVLKESSLRLRDTTTKGVVSLSDVNGSVATLADGSLKADVNFLLADRLTTFVGEVESAGRLFSSGSPADFTVSAPGMLFGFSGQAKFVKGVEFAGQTNVEANNTAALFRWLGMPLELLEGSGPFRMLSGLSSQGHSLKFENLVVNMGEETITGKASLSVGPDRVALSGDVDISRISLLPKTAVLAQGWSEKPITLSDFTALDFDLTLRAKQLELRGRKLGAMNAKITSEAQTIELVLPQQKLAGGDVETGFTISVQNGFLSLVSAFDLAEVETKVILGGLFGMDAVQGPLMTSGHLTMRGKTPAELISTMEGQWNLKATDATVSNLDFTAMLSNPTKGWPTQADMSGKAFDLDMIADVKDGIATVERFTLKNGSKNLNLKGEVDILRQAFDLQVGPLWLTGPWSLPEVKTR